MIRAEEAKQLTRAGDSAQKQKAETFAVQFVDTLEKRVKREAARGNYKLFVPNRDIIDLTWYEQKAVIGLLEQMGFSGLIDDGLFITWHEANE